MILCDEIVVEPTRANRYTLVGVTHVVRSFLEPPYPSIHPRMDVVVQLTSCQGPGQAWIEFVEADTGTTTAYSRTWQFPFRNDPLVVRNVLIRLSDVVFPYPGLYWVRLWYNNALLAEQSLFAR
jgi:hypothetical protein